MPISLSDLSILVIEDNQGDYILIEDYLQEEVHNITIHQVTTLSKAKTTLANQHFDVILLDLSLPDASGESLVKEIVRLSEGKPIIVLTGFADKEFGVKTVGLGVSDYLLKDELNAYQLSKSIAYSLERKRTESQIKESEKKYRDLFHLSPSPMMVFDEQTHEFLDVNQATIIHYGYSLEEFLAMKVTEIYLEEDADNFIRLTRESYRKPNFLLSNVRHKKKDGGIICVDIQSNPIELNGRHARLVLATDVSERTYYIQAIEAQNEKFQEIAWIQAHIVRAPLARMMGLINLLFDKKNPPQEIDEFLGYLEHSAKELDKIVRDIIQKTEETQLFGKKEEDDEVL